MCFLHVLDRYVIQEIWSLLNYDMMINCEQVFYFFESTHDVCPVLFLMYTHPYFSCWMYVPSWTI